MNEPNAILQLVAGLFFFGGLLLMLRGIVVTCLGLYVVMVSRTTFCHITQWDTESVASGCGYMLGAFLFNCIPAFFFVKLSGEYLGLFRG